MRMARAHEQRRRRESMFSRVTVLVGFMSWLTAAAGAGAAEPTVQFNRDVRPILSDKCFACHGLDQKKRKADLRLDLAASATTERKGVRAVVPGDVSHSALWARINATDADEVMPPPETHKTLSAAEKETLRRWIEQGAK